MLVEIQDVEVTSVYKDTFNDRNTGELVEYYRALLVPIGEAPLQVKVDKDEYEVLKEDSGITGNVKLEIKADPGRRQSIIYRGLVK